MRTGNLETPASARRSPSDLSRAAASSPCIIAVMRSASASAWGTGLSFKSCVIIDADAWLIERSEEHTSELQSLRHLVCRLLLEKKKKKQKHQQIHVMQ